MEAPLPVVADWKNRSESGHACVFEEIEMLDTLAGLPLPTATEDTDPLRSRRRNPEHASAYPAASRLF